MWKDYSRRKICNLLHKCDIKGNYSDPSIPFPKKNLYKWFFSWTVVTPFNSTLFVYMSVFECFVSLYKYMFMSPFILSLFTLFLSRQQQSVLHCRTSCKQFWRKTLHNNKFSCVYFSPWCFFLSFCRNVSTYIFTLEAWNTYIFVHVRMWLRSQMYTNSNSRRILSVYRLTIFTAICVWLTVRMCLCAIFHCFVT